MESKIVELIVLLIISGLGYYTIWFRFQEDKRKQTSINLSEKLYNRIKSQLKKS